MTGAPVVPRLGFGPAEAKKVWDELEGRPSIPRLREAMLARGMDVSIRTLKRWRKNNWEFGHLSQAAVELDMVIAKAEKLDVGTKKKRRPTWAANLPRLPDSALIKEIGRKQLITVGQCYDRIEKAADMLILDSPAEFGKLMQALSSVVMSGLLSYDRAIGLVERTMRLVEPNPPGGGQEILPPVDMEDPLAEAMHALGKAIERSKAA